jgi:hypothetical protein
MRKNQILVKFFVNANDAVLNAITEEAATTFTGDGGTQVGHLEKAVASSLLADLREFGYGCTDARWKKQATRSGKSGVVVTLTFVSGAQSVHDTVCSELQDRTYHHVYVWDNPGNMTINFVAPGEIVGTVPVRMNGDGTIVQ